MKGLFDRNVLIATVLLMAWLLVYSLFLAPKPPEPPAVADPQTAPSQGEVAQAPPPASAPAEAAPAAAAPEAPTPPPPAALVPLAEEEIVIETGRYRAVLTSRGGRVKSWELLGYRRTIAPDSPPYEIIPDLVAREPYAGAVILAGPQGGLPADLPMRVEERGDRRVVFVGQTPAGLELRKELLFDDERFTVATKVRVTNGTSAPVSGQIATPIFEKLGGQPAPGCLTGACGGGAEALQARHQVSFVRRSLKDRPVGPKLENVEVPSGVFWTGFADMYFLSAAVSKNAEETGMSVQVDPAAGVAETRLVYPKVDLAPGQSIEREFLLYLGPKTKEDLTAAGYDLPYSVDYGWFGAIANGFVAVLKFFYRYLHNWGLAIIVLTVLVKVVLYPLTLKSYRSMNQMSRIQPLLKELREKYKDDRERMNQEMMRLYKEHGVNPAGGCLPILLQLPIFIAFYRALYQSIELRHAGFVLWIQDLSAPDPYYVTPIVMGATQWLSQRLTPTTGDPAQARMMQLMPVFFTVLFLNFPSGLVLYWLVNNVLTIAQQKWIMHKNPAPPLPVPKPKAEPAATEPVRRKKKRDRRA